MQQASFPKGASAYSGRRVAALWLLVRAAISTDPWRTLAGFVAYPLASVSWPLVGLLSGALVDGAIEGRTGAAAVSAAGIVLAVLTWEASRLFSQRISRTLVEDVGFALHERIARLVGSMPTIEHLERPDLLDRIELLRAESWWLGRAMQIIPAALAQTVSVAATLVLLGRIDARLVLLIVVIVPAAIVGLHGEGLLMTAEEKMADPMRRAGHLFSLGTSVRSADELRVMRITGRIREAESDAWGQAASAYSRAGVRWAATEAATNLGYAVAFGAAVALVVWQAARGEATPGDVVLTLVASAELHGFAGVAGSIASRVKHAMRAAGRLIDLEDYAGSLPRGEGEPPPDVIRDGIVLERVSFSYGATEALSEVSLFLPAGSTVAIVGENGAGKTTLVKLLCGLFRPSGGRILIDGADLSSIDLEAWRARLSAAFQDFARFEFEALESIGLGEVSALGPDRVADALERAGVDLPVPSLTTRVQSLSGGEWQKIALARAMMRRQPLLLILDEPTAALDALAEQALFERWSTADAGITILVSHRFSTVRMADTIVVLASGRVVEQGSHEDLVARGGTYAELFELQARSYR